ncbi:hypothetical protein ACLOJK_028146 [Asimina triloba]
MEEEEDVNDTYKWERQRERRALRGGQRREGWTAREKANTARPGMGHSWAVRGINSIQLIFGGGGEDKRREDLRRSGASVYSLKMATLSHSPLFSLPMTTVISRLQRGG